MELRERDLRERHDDGDQHPDRTDPVAAARSRRVRQEPQREDEADDRREVGEVGGDLAHRAQPVGGALRSSRPVSAAVPSRARRSAERARNISSIRSVTTKPPTTFAEARTTATSPMIVVTVSLWPRPATSIAPTITIPWIAFVPDISGVCSRGGTFEITSKPRKIASTRIVTSKTSSVLWLKPVPPACRQRTRRRWSRC